MKPFFLALAAALAFSAVGVPSAAQSKAPPSETPKKGKKDAAKKDKASKKHAIEVLVLHATNSKKGIDKRIQGMRELRNPPFSSYDSYQLLTKQQLAVAKGDAKTLKLPNGRVLQTELLDILPKDRFRIAASINHPGGKTFLPLLKVKAKLAQRFIVAGQSYKGGILVLVIRIIAL